MLVDRGAAPANLQRFLRPSCTTLGYEGRKPTDTTMIRRIAAPALAGLTLAASAAMPQAASAQVVVMTEQLYGLCEWFRGLPGCPAAPQPAVSDKSNYQNGRAHSTELGQPGYPVVNTGN